MLCTDLSDKIKRNSSKLQPGEKARWELLKDAECSFKKILETVPYKTTGVWSHTSHLTNHLSKICWRTNSLMTFSYGLLHMETPVLVNQ